MRARRSPLRARRWCVLGGGALALFAAVFALSGCGGDGGRETATVPNVVGSEQSAATARLRRAGFKTEIQQQTSHRAAGVVLTQFPESGAILSEGSRVGLAVSLGPPEVTVPTLTGLTSAGATRLLRTLNLTPLRRVVASNRRAGLVLAQNPPAGLKVSPNATVSFDVARGPTLVTVPSVRGASRERAVRILARAGLVPDIRQVRSPEPIGTVVAQDPPRQARVRARTRVTINVSRGTGLISVPALRGASRQAAIARVRAAGLTPVVREVASGAPAGRVVAQEPPRQARVAPGTRVRINVSRGPAGTTTETGP